MARKKINLAYAIIEGGPVSNKSISLLNKIFRYFISITVLVSVIAVIMETVEEISTSYSNIFINIETIAITIFTIEYIARLWVCTADRSGKYKHPIWGRLRYMISPMAIIDLLAILPFFLMPLVSDDFLILRLIRLMRMMKFIRYSPFLNTLWSVLYREKNSIMTVISTMFIMLIFASSLMWMIEHKAQPEAFSSIPETLWWAMSTLTTVGYGDMVPITPIGRFVGMFIMLTGIGFFTMPAAVLASGFIREINKREISITYAMVSKVPLFANLKADMIAEIVQHLTPRKIPARYTILRRTEIENELCFILSGKVELDFPHSSIILKQGDFFGEMAMLEDGTLSATHINTLEDTELMVLDKENFKIIAEKFPKIKSLIKEAAEDRAKKYIYKA